MAPPHFLSFGVTKLLSSFSLLFLAPEPGVALTIPATRFAQHAAALLITAFLCCVSKDGWNDFCPHISHHFISQPCFSIFTSADLKSQILNPDLNMCTYSRVVMQCQFAVCHL